MNEHHVLNILVQ